MSLFITGTDTDVGKTHIAARLLLVGLGENLTELPVDWRLMLESTKGH